MQVIKILLGIHPILYRQTTIFRAADGLSPKDGTPKVRGSLRPTKSTVLSAFQKRNKFSRIQSSTPFIRDSMEEESISSKSHNEIAPPNFRRTGRKQSSNLNSKFMGQCKVLQLNLIYRS